MKARDRSIIGFVALLVIAVGGYVLLVQPKHHQAHQLQRAIESKQTQLSQAEAEVQSGVHTEMEYATYVKQLRAITVAVPNDQQIPQLITQLQSASSRNRVSFQAVSESSSSTATSSAPTTGTASSAFPSQSFTLSFAGSYFSVARLLGTISGFVRADDKHFQASGRLLSFSTLSLTPGGSGTSTAPSGSGAVTASVTALDYDVPTSLSPESLTPESGSAQISTASPAAYVKH
jgi:hypothetical protein